MAPVTSITWAYLPAGNSAGIGSTLAVGGITGTSLTGGTVIFTYVKISPPASYGYGLPCVVSSVECDKITINQTARTMDFDNVVTENTPGNSATAQIVIDGPFTW